jgi:hypothetical protein
LLAPPRRALAAADAVTQGLAKGDAASAQRAVDEIRSTLDSNALRAVERLNEDWMAALLRARRYDEVQEFALRGTVAAARDTWRFEQVQKHRIRALLESGRAEQALAAAKGLYNVCGTGFVPECLQILSDCLRAAHPGDRALVTRFKLQQLADAQTDESARKAAVAEAGEPVLATVKADPEPYRKAIEGLQGKEDFASLYAMGNLLLLSDRVAEAKAAFDKAYAVAPATELRYVTEAVAKVMKAEDGGVGRMNAWIVSIRPAE